MSMGARRRVVVSITESTRRSRALCSHVMRTVRQPNHWQRLLSSYRNYTARVARQALDEHDGHILTSSLAGPCASYLSQLTIQSIAQGLWEKMNHVDTRQDRASYSYVSHCFLLIYFLQGGPDNFAKQQRMVKKITVY